MGLSFNKSGQSLHGKHKACLFVDTCTTSLLHRNRLLKEDNILSQWPLYFLDKWVPFSGNIALVCVLNRKRAKVLTCRKSALCACCSLEVTQSYTRVTLTKQWTTWGLVHFVSYKNSPTDAAEIKGLIKFHAPKCGLIIAGPGGDLFPMALTGMGAGDQVHSEICWPLLKGKSHEAEGPESGADSIVPKSRAGEGSKRLSTGARLAEEDGSGLHGVYLGKLQDLLCQVLVSTWKGKES